MTTVTSTPFSVTTVAGGTSFAYLNGMSNYQVKQLTTVAAGGFVTKAGATPSIWLTADPGTNDGNTIDFWSGGIGDPATNKLYCIGGGHNNSYDNGIYVYDFTGNSVPNGFSLLAGSQSLPSAITVAATATYNDGRAPSAHTYDGIVFVDGKIYQIGGAVAGTTGSFGTGVWRFANGAWQLMGNMTGGQMYALSTVLDPITKKILIWPSGVNSPVWFYDTVAETLGSVKNIGFSFPSGGNYSTSLYIPAVGARAAKVVMVCAYNGVGTVNFSAETISWTTRSASGITTEAGVGALYDPTRDKIWLLAGSSGGAGYSSIYEMDPATYALTAHPYASGSVGMASDGAQFNFTFKRVVLINNGAAIGIVTNYQQAAYVIKLP